jgi:transcriptional regulator with XRE-family HTH domain
MEVYMDLGKRIRDARRAAGLTQEEVARRANMSAKGWGELERGIATDPHYSTLKNVANALGMTPERLIAEPVDPGKARAAASQASKAAADARKSAKDFRLQAIEAHFKDLLSRAQEERKAGNETQAQLSAHKALLLQRGAADNADGLRNARWGLLAAGAMAGSREVEDLLAQSLEFEDLLERLNSIVRGLGGRTLSEEESEALRDQARGETA